MKSEGNCNEESVKLEKNYWKIKAMEGQRHTQNAGSKLTKDGIPTTVRSVFWRGCGATGLESSREPSVSGKVSLCSESERFSSQATAPPHPQPQPAPLAPVVAVGAPPCHLFLKLGNQQQKFQDVFCSFVVAASQKFSAMRRIFGCDFWLHCMQISCSIQCTNAVGEAPLQLYSCVPPPHLHLGGKTLQLSFPWYIAAPASSKYYREKRRCKYHIQHGFKRDKYCKGFAKWGRRTATQQNHGTPKGIQWNTNEEKANHIIYLFIKYINTNQQLWFVVFVGLTG